MALVKQVTGPRWVTIAWEFELKSGDFVQWVDPAVNMEKSDLKGYWDSLFSDESCLVYHDGQKPTRFRIRPLTPRQKDAAAGLEGRALAIHRVTYGLLDVENRCYVDADGCMSVAESPKLKKGDLGPAVPIKYIREMDLPEMYLIALGVMVNHISEAQAPLSNSSGQPPGPGARSDEESDE